MADSTVPVVLLFSSTMKTLERVTCPLMGCLEMELPQHTLAALTVSLLILAPLVSQHRFPIRVLNVFVS